MGSVKCMIELPLEYGVRLMVSGIMYIRDAEYWLVAQVSRRYVTASLGGADSFDYQLLVGLCHHIP